MSAIWNEPGPFSFCSPLQDAISLPPAVIQEQDAISSLPSRHMKTVPKGSLAACPVIIPSPAMSPRVHRLLELPCRLFPSRFARWMVRVAMRKSENPFSFFRLLFWRKVLAQKVCGSHLYPLFLNAVNPLRLNDACGSSVVKDFVIFLEHQMSELSNSWPRSLASPLLFHMYENIDDLKAFTRTDIKGYVWW